MGETPKREHSSVQRQQQEYHDQQSQHLTTTPTMVSMFDWLSSLRIPSEDAQEYTKALLALGFDDVQSLDEV